MQHSWSIKVWMEDYQIKTPWKPLECDQEEDGWSQAIKQTQVA